MHTQRHNLFLTLLSGSVALFLWCASTSMAAAFDDDMAAEWKAGAATVDITPRESLWMAGYASRTKPSEGALSPLKAKALAIEDLHGNRAVIVTTDLISIPRVLRERVLQAVVEKHQWPAESILLNCSHTHCGPVVRDDLEMSVMYQLEPDMRQRVEAYFVTLSHQLIDVIGQAITNRRAVKLGYSHARCGFAMNRRLPSHGGVQNSPYPDGPVDHSVPVLRVENSEGQLIAVAFGYACHNTTTSVQQFNADYAGVAQQEIEQAHPGCVALFVMGCGGDQNPYPRGKYEWALLHGKSLATAVEAALLPQPRVLHPPLLVAGGEVELEMEPATKPQLEELLTARDAYDQRRAKLLLAEIEQKGAVRDRYPFPYQVLQFGKELTLVSLAGEVVVDYSLLLKQQLAELPGPNSAVWVAGYSHDVFAYIPSERVLREGGYEGGGAMRYAALPGPFRPGVEQKIMTPIVGSVRTLRGKLP